MFLLLQIIVKQILIREKVKGKKNSFILNINKLYTEEKSTLLFFFFFFSYFLYISPILLHHSRTKFPRIKPIFFYAQKRKLARPYLVERLTYL